MKKNKKKIEEKLTTQKRIENDYSRDTSSLINLSKPIKFEDLGLKLPARKTKKKST